MRIVSFDGVAINDGLFYVSSLTAGGQVPAEATIDMVGRTGGAPALGDTHWPERYLAIATYIPTRNVNKRPLQQDWYRLFRFGKVARLVIADDDGGRERYVMAAAFVIQHDAGGDGWSWQTLVAVDGDGDGELAWRDVEPVEVVWTVDEDGAEIEIVNDGDLEAWPVVEVEQVTPAQVYARQFAIVWWSQRKAVNYPIEITNGGIDTRIASTNFVDADGDDIHVYVDGVEVDRWLVDPNTASTKIWILADFLPAAYAQTMAGMGTGDLDILKAMPYVDEGGAGAGEFGASGIARINNEIVTYDLRVGTTFFGVRRGQFGTTAAAHSANALVMWVEHDIRVEYGEGAGASPRVVDDRRRPMFDMTSSSNDVWVYTEFREVGNPDRAASWTPISLLGGQLYTVTQDGTPALLYEVMGSKFPTAAMKRRFESRWMLSSPVGFMECVFTNGKRFSGYRDTDWDCQILYSYDLASWGGGQSIAAPAANQSWESWSISSPMGFNGYGVAMSHIDATDASRESYLECGDVTVNLRSAGFSALLAGPEESVSRVGAWLGNETLGEGVGISYAVASGEDTTLEIDADRYTMKLGGVDRNRPGLALPDSLRTHLLRLRPGTNTLRYEDAQIGEARVTVRFERRWLA